MTSQPNVVHPVIRRYANGEISAMQAASLLGDQASVGDVIAMLRLAGLPPPLPPPEQQKAELAHARRVLGLPQVPES
jgi:hypothetical protein